MMTEPRFTWKCSYMGTVDYMVTDDTGTYFAELRHSVDSYELSLANGDGVRADWKSSIGILRRRNCIRRADGSYSFEVPPETVDAFNAWCLQRYRESMAHLESQPERYGFIPPDDPIRKPPILARGGDYRFGEHAWEVTHAFA